MALIDPYDVAEHLQRVIEGADYDYCADLIDMVQAEAEAIACRPFGQEERVETHRIISGAPTVYLLASPVVSVSQVRYKADGSETWTVWDAESYALDGAAITDFPLLSRPGVVETTYVGGLADDRALGCKLAILQRVGRLMNKRQDDALGTTQSNVEGDSVSYETEGFTEDEVNAIRRRRRVLAL